MKQLMLVVVVLAYMIAFAANKVFHKTVGFDYDSTLAFSTPTFLAEREADPEPTMNWELINGKLLSKEKKKKFAWAVTAVKFFGYTPILVTSRPETNSEEFKDHVERVYGIRPEHVYMTREKAKILKQCKAVLFFGDSDMDITQARKAGVTAIRIKRSEDDLYKDNYNPGKYGEFVMPFSAAHE